MAVDTGIQRGIDFNHDFVFGPTKIIVDVFFSNDTFVIIFHFEIFIKNLLFCFETNDLFMKYTVTSHVAGIGLHVRFHMFSDDH